MARLPAAGITESDDADLNSFTWEKDVKATITLQHPTDAYQDQTHELSHTYRYNGDAPPGRGWSKFMRASHARKQGFFDFDCQGGSEILHVECVVTAIECRKCVNDTD